MFLDFYTFVSFMFEGKSYDSFYKPHIWNAMGRQKALLFHLDELQSVV